MTIQQWPCEERPREKLLNRGSEALSDAELLAVFLRNGYAGCSAVDLARSMIGQFGGLRGVLEAPRSALMQVHGVGAAKIALLEAAVILGERYLSTEVIDRQYVSSSSAVKKLLLSRLRKHNNECFDGLFLCAQHSVIAIETLFTGSISESMVYPRTLVARCLHHNAAALIIAHNHPSGCSQPSQADKALTRHLKKLLADLDITLLDHMVIGDQAFSFAEQGLL